MSQVPNTAAQVIQVPATPGPSTAGNVQNPQGTVRYMRVPAGTAKATYNLRPATLNNVTTVNTPAMVTTTSVTAEFADGPSKTGATYSWKCSYA